MKRIFRPQIVVIGAITVSLLAWSAGAAAAGSRTGSHVAVRNAESTHAALSPRADVTPEARAAEQAEEAAEEQNEQAEAPEDENDDEQEVENQAATAPPAPPAAVTSKNFNLVGGTVTFTCSGNVISLGSAVPNTGFSVETEREDGGQEIKVRFESNTHRSEIRATCVGGQVQATEIREESD